MEKDSLLLHMAGIFFAKPVLINQGGIKLCNQGYEITVGLTWKYDTARVRRFVTYRHCIVRVWIYKTDLVRVAHLATYLVHVQLLQYSKGSS